MGEEEILLLRSQGYDYNPQGYIVDTEGNYLSSVKLNDKEIFSEISMESFKTLQDQESTLKEKGYVHNPNSIETHYDQQQAFKANVELDEYLKNPNSTILDKENPYMQKAFKQAQKDGRVEEYTMDALEANTNAFSDDPTITELSEIQPENINSLKEVRKQIEEISKKDEDVDTIMEGILTEEREERAWYNPNRLGDWMWDTIYSGVAALTPTGTGMDDDKLKETYRALKVREKELLEPAIKSKIRKEKAAIEKMEAAYASYIEENGNVQGGTPMDIPFLTDAIGDEGDAMQYMLGKKKARLESLEDYLTHENQNWFMRNLWNPVTEAGGEAMREITWAETAHSLNNILGAAKRFNKGEATAQDKLILEDYADQIEHEEFKGQLPSLGAVHDTAAGVTHSLGFMGEMTIGGGIFKKGAKSGAKKLGAKYVDDVIIKAINSLGRRVPASVKPVVKGTLNNSKKLVGEVVGAGLTPLGMSSTYSGTFQTMHPIVRDEEGMLLMDQDAYQYETSKLEGQLLASKQIIEELSSKPNLTEDDKKNLKQAMSFVGVNEEIHGIKRNKAIPTHKELTENLKPISGFDAFYNNYTSQVSETLSERVGQLGIGKALSKTRLGKAVTNNKVGRAITETNKNINKFSGGHVHSIFDEIIEENLVPVFNYAFNGKESELHSMMNMDAQKDVAIQTVAMNMLFRIPGAVQDNLTKAGRENKKWRKEQKQVNRQEKERLSKLYKSIATIGTQEDLSKIIDLTSIPGASNQKTEAAIKVLELQGKTEEANKLRNSMFNHNAIQAVRTGTTEDFKAALNKIVKNPKVNVATRTSVATALNNLEKFKGYQEKYQDSRGSKEIVENLLNRDTVKQELKNTEAARVAAVNENREEFNTFERNFESRYNKFIKDNSTSNPNSETLDNNGPQETMTSGISYLTKRFKDPTIQAEYSKLLMNSAKEFSPELQSVVNTTAQKENALRESITTSDKVHIDLTSRRKQAELRAKEVLHKKLLTKYLKDKKSLTPEEMDALMGENKEDLKNLTKEEIQEVKDTVTENITNINVAKVKAKREASQQAAIATMSKAQTTPKPVAKPKVEANTKADEGVAKEVGSLAAMLESGLLTSGGNIPNEDVQAFSPREFDPEQISDAQKENIIGTTNAYADSMERELGREPNFEDMIKDRIERAGFENTDEIYNTLKYMWELSGRDISNAPNVYNSYFNAVDNFNNLSQEIANIGAIEGNKETVREAIISNSKTTHFDKRNRPVEKDGKYSNDGRTTSFKPKAAHLGIQYQEIKNADNTISKIPVLPQLNKSQQIDNHLILDSDFIKQGVTMDVNIPENVNSLKVADWQFKENRWVKSEISFGDWVNKYNVTPGSDIYNNKVPMVASIEGKNIFFLHDTDWYNTSNVGEGSKEDIEELSTEDMKELAKNGNDFQKLVIKQGIQSVANIRANVLNGNNNITVEERKFGSIFNLSDLATNNGIESLNEATGDTKLAIAKNDTQLIDSTTTGDSALNDNIELVNNFDKTPLIAGVTYEMRHVNTKADGTKQYLALRVLTNNRHKDEPLNNTVFNNVKFAVLSSVYLNNRNNKILTDALEQDYGLTLSKAKNIHQNIKEDSKIDIQFEIGDYMNMFVQVEDFNSNMISKLEDTSMNPITGQSKYPNNTNYISVDNNIVKIALKDGQPIKRNEKGYDKLPGIPVTNVNENNTKIILGLLHKHFNAEDGDFRKTHFDISKKQLNRNNSFTIISDTGATSKFTSKHGESSYEGFIKDTVKSNVKSFPIENNKGETQWVTDVQPMVYYGLSKEVNIPTQEQKIQKASQAALNEIVTKTEQPKDIVKAIKALPAELKEQLGNFNLDELDDDLVYSRREFSEDISNELDAITTSLISSITPLQQKKLVSSLFNLILADTDLTNHTVSLKTIGNNIDSSLETYLVPKITEMVNYVGNLKNLENPAMQPLIDKFQKRIDQLQTIVDEKDKIISKGGRMPKGDLYKKFERFLAEELTGTEDLIENDNGEMEFSFNASSLEKDVKLSFSNSLKIFFSNIKKQKKETREDIKNFAQLNDYESVDDVKDYLTDVMVELPSSVEELISILETKKSNSIYNQILNKIKNAPKSIQNEILYKMIQSKLDMYMVLYSFNNQDKTYSLKIINPNSGATDVRLKKQWFNNFRSSDLFKTVEEERIYNKPTALAVIKRISNLSKLKKIDSLHEKAIKDVLTEIGITLEDNVVKALVEREGTKIFTKSGILGVFKNSLSTILKRGDNLSINDDKNNPFSNARGVLEKLVELDTELNGTKVAKSFRVDGKSIQGAIQKMMIYDIKEDLRDPSSTYFQALKQIPYSKDNYILKLLENNNKFQDNFDVGFVSLEAIKEHGKKKYGDRKINKLAETDNMLTQFAFFQNTLRELEVANTNLNFRMGHMFNPALSDKEQMLVYSTALLNLNYKDFDINNEVKLSDEVLSFVTSQIYDGEINRILNTYANPTNIKNYDGAAKRFISIPELNNMTSAEGANIHDVLSSYDANDTDTAEEIKNIFRPIAKGIIANTIKSDVDNKVSKEWVDNGFITNGDKDIDISYFDTKYLKNKKGNNNTLTNKQVAEIAAYDFVVNQFLNQNNVYQLMAGDMALYAPKLGRYTDKKTGEVDNIAFTKAVGESISKRMAMLIAPGNKLANSHNDKYIQLMVEDPIKITSSARELIKQYYGVISENNNKQLIALDKVEDQIQKLYLNKPNNKFFDKHLSTYNEIRDEILDDLKKSNPEIGGYFDIEGTDAQEYTTWKEHVDTLFRQGRLTEEEQNLLSSAYNKLSKGETLSGPELGVVMNPIKPVYAGSNVYKDKDGKPNVNRIVYIKSSSFPLLPQLTADFKLDAIRKQMESLQEKEGRNVRLSYQTANKVGAINTKLTTNDLYNIPFEDLYNSKLRNSMLTLDRNNFKIQQDTPYKTDKFLKKNSDDMTTMGSQMWKIILGNGINKIDAKIFPQIFGEDLIANINRKVGEAIIPANGMVSGKDLDKIKFHTEKMYFDIQKELLFDELGINPETRVPNNMNETIKLLHDLLERETTTRQYPEGIVDSLKLVTEDGNLEFLLPIWLSNGSNKFESLLQSIITNRLIQINLPGNQLISSSSEGFEKVVSDASTDLSDVVWIDPSHTGELKATRTENGVLKEAEILIQSKFRKTVMENGKRKTKLIDLTLEPYSTNGVLNKEMIDAELLTSFSFRIPTSSHQSGAILKVVGFLPEASGDMLVVPKEHTQQIGEDFDIDKRTLYKSNYEVKESGKIAKINYNQNPSEKLLQAIGGNDFDTTLSFETNKTKELKVKTKMLENAMVDIYKSVYQSPDKDIQKKINKILSFDNASDTANIINDRINSSEDTKYFTLFSDNYQRAQMKLGADGKTGIGGHSNAVTFQAQMERLDNNLIMQDPVFGNEGEIIRYTPRFVQIGEYVSDGVLGKIKTLDGERTIGDIHTENQNSATDNIKAQIMGKRNENPYTMNVLIQMTFRGFDMATFTPRTDKQPKSLQLSSLFISQPILRRYVELKEKGKSITAEFDGKSEQTILKTLLEEFGSKNPDLYSLNEYGQVDKTNFMDTLSYANAVRRMSGDTLYDNLLTETSEEDIQLATLQSFFRLEEEAKHLGKYQSLINLSTSGLGISYFNVLDRIKGINDMGYEQDIANVRDLVGEFIHVEDFQENTPANADDFTLIGDFYIRPTTTEGTVLVYSVSSAEDIMDISFPYKQEFIENTVEGILEAKDKELGKARKNELQYKVVTSIKDYLHATKDIGLFSGDINSERKRLFFDTQNNKSLASFLKDLKDFKNHPIMQSNELLKALAFDGIQRNGAPSIIKHQTDFNNNFDKTDKYNSFLELMQDNRTNLGVFNGTVMTPRKLAQDLASYAYLANNENGAIGFRDFIHTRYLDIVGVSNNIRNINSSRNGYSMPSTMMNFEKQFYQHNPEEARIMSPTNTSIEAFVSLDDKSNKYRNKIKAEPDSNKQVAMMNGFLQGLDTFTLKEEGPKFISVRNTSIKLSDNQYNLYEWDGVKYVRVPVLGTFGFNEYNPEAANQTSLIYPEVGAQVSLKPMVKVEVKQTVNLNEILDLSKGVVSLMAQLKHTDKFKKLATQIAPFIDATTQVKVQEVSTKNGDLKTAMYRKSDNTIYINPNIVNNLLAKKDISFDNVNDVIDEVVLEEIIHSMTISQLDKFGTMANGVYSPNSDAPVFISKLASLYEVAKENLPNEYYTKDIYEFTAGVFVSDEFKQKLDNTKVDGKNLLDKFKDAVSSMIRFLSTGTYSSEVRNAVHELLNYTKASSETSVKPNIMAQMKKKDVSIDAELDKVIKVKPSLPVKKEIITPKVEIVKVGKGTFTYQGKTINTDFHLTEEQTSALKELIDFSLNKEENLITLSGYAGTGKTSIIKYLEEYLKEVNFIYSAPTHAATVYLGLNTSVMPYTVQSIYSARFNPNTKKTEYKPTSKFEKSLSIFQDNILVIDEASMLGSADLKNMLKSLKGMVKIIFMGDKAQLPEVTSGVKNISDVFTKMKNIQLTEVKRTKDDGILSVLTEIRENPDGTLPIVNNTDTLKYYDNGLKFKKAAFQDIKNNPEDTIYISYTNKDVQSFNSQVREGLGYTGDLKVGENIVGYGGYNSKSVTSGHLGNSIKYTVDKVDVKDDGKVVISYSSKILEKIASIKESGKYKGSTTYLQLSDSDSLTFSNISQEKMENNNKLISKYFKELQEAKITALNKKGRAWAAYYDKLAKTSKALSRIELGAKYIYNPTSNRMELFTGTPEQVKRNKTFSELTVDKGIDFGYAITIHKSQGATFNNVYFNAATVNNHAPIMEEGKQIGTEGNSLNYVGMSRASKKLNVLKGTNTKNIKKSVAPKENAVITDLKNQVTYTPEKSQELIKAFDNRESITVTPAKNRVRNSPEYKYVADLISHIEAMNNIKVSASNIVEYIIIENISDDTQTIKKKPSLEDMLGSGLLTTGGDSYSKNEFRLPEIKKCK